MPHRSPLQAALHRHVDILAGLIGERNTLRPRALDATRAYLQRQFDEIGLAIAEMPYPVRARSAINYELTLPGRDPSLPELVVGAHYDSAIGTPGADDNASAVAILIELARALRAVRLRRTVRFVFYDTEEMPHFATGEMGSQKHAEHCRRKKRQLMGMVCLESLGYFKPPQPQTKHWSNLILRPLGQHVIAVSNLRSIAFLARFTAALWQGGERRVFALPLPERVDVIHLSDHRGYWEQGYPALMLTDTAMLRNPNYHRPTDLPKSLDYRRMTTIASALIVAVRQLAK